MTNSQLRLTANLLVNYGRQQGQTDYEIGKSVHRMLYVKPKPKPKK